MKYSDKQISYLPQTGIFLCDSKTRTPVIFENFINRFSGIPSTVIFLKPVKSHVPRIDPTERIKVKKLQIIFFFVSVSFGYFEHMGVDTIDRILKNGPAHGLPAISLEDTTILASAELINVINSNWLWKPVLYLYSLMKRVFFGLYVIDLPPTETVYLASLVTM